MKSIYEVVDGAKVNMGNNRMIRQPGFTTNILHGDRRTGIEHGSLHKPVHTSVAYGYQKAEDLAAVFQNKATGFAYGRQGNPTVSALENQISVMESAVGSVCFSTGMAAIAATMSTLLRAGDHLIASSFLFGNTDSYFKTLMTHGIEVSFVDATSMDNVKSELRPNTKAIFVETIANPCTQICDLAGIGAFCADQKILYIVDNTLTTPYLFQAREVNAGLVISSLTKYIAGHGNVLGGAVTDTGLFDWQRYSNIYEQYKTGDASSWGLRQIRKKGLRDTGGSLAPQSAHQISIGTETLALRMRQSCASAQTLAESLEKHPAVNKVFYPGLKSHPQYDRAKTLFRANSSIFSIELKSGLDCFRFLNALDVIINSSNLGDNRTLVIPVAHTIYYEMGQARRQQMGISDDLIRLSIGIEEIDDLMSDIHQALKAAGIPRRRR